MDSRGLKKIKGHLNYEILIILGNLKILPEEIRTSLMNFKIRFGAGKIFKVN